ncbi:myosin-3-like [Diorhabda carinulata]|uniref:myosin-3-like n=1 Tax=Diorhabda carinulata TaxID=1163345 RepID=UPI0025A2B35D|nr:myosin-3-like [Diorhabda carinulata]
MINHRKVTNRAEKTEFLKRLNNIYALIEELENNLSKSAKLDRQILLMIRLDQISKQNMTNQLNEAQTENKQLLGMMQLSENGRDVPRSNSSTSCNTMSLVHLQYKYEELLANQNGLLKILDIRQNEVRKYQTENTRLKEEIENAKFILQKYETEFKNLLEKISRLKSRKNRKIEKLKEERDTLRLVHNRFVSVLTKQSLEKDDILSEQLQNTSNSEKALLLQEVRKNNYLMYENFQLHQKMEYLESKLNVKRSSRNDVSTSVSRTSSN